MAGNEDKWEKALQTLTDQFKAGLMLRSEYARELMLIAQQMRLEAAIEEEISQFYMYPNI